jgi:hypothetical protein
LSLQPPDLSERSSDREALLARYWEAIRQLTSLAELPASQWSAEQASAFPASVPGGPPESPRQRLARWLSLYRDEIDTIRVIRGRLMQGAPTADSELRGGVYLARHVIASAMGVSPSSADSAARRLLTLPS